MPCLISCNNEKTLSILRLNIWGEKEIRENENEEFGR
jgi:hypothetical protein